MYEADPFAARKAVDERQEKAVQKREQASTGAEVSSTSLEYLNAPEVKMSASVREAVEESIRKVSEDASILTGPI